MAAACGEGRRRRPCAEQGCWAGDSTRGWGQPLLPVELCDTDMCGCSTPGCWGGCRRTQPPIGLCHPQCDPGKRGRGEREAKGLFIFKMFYNGIISSQEVFRIDLVRNHFHFSSAEMRWESSLWCKQSQSSGNCRSEKLPACWKDTLGSPGPHAPHTCLLLRLRRNSAVRSIPVRRAAAPWEQQLCQGGVCLS